MNSVVEKERLSYWAYLWQTFRDRKRQDKKYSLRLFSRDLGVSLTVLSDVMNGKRHLSISNAHRIFEKLALEQTQRESFIREILALRRKPRSRENFREIYDDQFTLISDWYHYAILNLAKLPQNSSDLEWIAKTLDITKDEAEGAVDRLKRLGFLRIENGRLVRYAPNLSTKNDVPSTAIQNYHSQIADRAKRSLKKDPTHLREFQATTFPVSLKKLPEAKRLIRKFDEQIRKLYEGSSPDEIYCLSLQFFPLSHQGRAGSE